MSDTEFEEEVVSVRDGTPLYIIINSAWWETLGKSRQAEILLRYEGVEDGTDS